MSHRLVFRRVALEELREARVWYEESRAGLGDDFVLCVEAALDEARRHPERYPVVHGDVRRVLIRRFPYGVYYAVESKRVVVLAVFHGRRDPDILQQRH